MSGSMPSAPPRSLRGVSWSRSGYWVAGGYIAFVAVLIACAYLWVWIYSAFVHPGEALAFYEAHARRASPIVALVTGVPVFYLGCRWIGTRAPAHAVGIAFGIVLLHFALEVALAVSVPAEQAALLWKVLLVGEPTKLAAAWLGARAARRAAG